MIVASEKLARFQNTMIEYWQAHGRHFLLWRMTTDPWRILLAEVLLRKTTSAQAADVYAQIVDFTPQQIMQIDQNRLAKLLQPLGINHVRADQIRRIASEVAVHGIDALRSDKFLRKLPGVGRYISNAVRCCAFGIPAPAMDTNMIRLMARVFGWQSNRQRPREDSKLWETAEAMIPPDKPREFNWGVLDFGAAVCTHRKPKCGICPVNDICIYYETIYLSVAENT